MGHAASLFNGNGEHSLIKRITPTSDQRDFLQQHWNALADHLKETLSLRHGFKISTWLQGSYKYATLIRPLHLGEEYDVDVGIYFEWSDISEGEGGEPSAKQLREWVQAELLEYARSCEDLREVAVPPKERCSRASYQHQFHIDTPVYHLDPTEDDRRLACFSGAWEASDPKAIYKWFRSAVVGDDRDQLRRLVRYLKAWAVVNFIDIPAFATVIYTLNCPDDSSLSSSARWQL